MPTLAPVSLSIAPPAPALSAAAAKLELTALAQTANLLAHQVARLVAASLPCAKEAQMLVAAAATLEARREDLRTQLSEADVRNLCSPPAAPAHARPKRKVAQLRAAHTQELVTSGVLVDQARFQVLMGGTTEEFVLKAIADNHIFFVEHEGARYFPAFYADPAYKRNELELVTKILAGLPAGSKLQFFLTGKGSLDGLTPLKALAAGELANVKCTATGFAER